MAILFPYPRRCSALFLSVLLVGHPERGGAQATPMAPDTSVQVVAADDARGAARSAQARFEIRRARLLPRSLGGTQSPCDENVGRFCSWYGEGGWTPEAEVPEIATLRAALLDSLRTLHEAAPGDAWILGQRVWYTAEGTGWSDALEVARTCGPPQDRWWCAALLGLALHGLGRWEEAERSYDQALWEMDVERAWRWPRAPAGRGWRRTGGADPTPGGLHRFRCARAGPAVEPGRPVARGAGERPEDGPYGPMDRGHASGGGTDPVRHLVGQ